MPDTATVQITMPEMGESVTEGIILEWHVAIGDFFNEGATVVEVSTDKVDAEVPATTSGTVTKLLVEVDDEVPVGAPMLEMESGEAATDGGGTNGATAGPVAAEPSAPAGIAGADPSSAPPADGASTPAGTNGGNGSGADVKATP